MQLTFLTPAVLAGAALIAVPIIIHLILKKKPKHLMFPAFRFLQQRHRTNLQKLRLRHLLLLAMRILLILVFCAALARPELTGGPRELAGNAKVGVIFVFDTSASMAYEHNGKSLLETAKEQALSLLHQLPPGSKIVVLDTGDVGGQPVDVSQAESLITSRQLRLASRPVTDSLKEALRMLEKEKSRSASEGGSLADLPLVLVLFSDRTAASWNPDAVSASLLPGKKRMEDRIGKQLPCIYLDLGPAEAHNVAITSVGLKPTGAANAQPLETLTYGVPARGTVRFQATIQATGTAIDGDVLLFMDGEVKDTKRLRISAPAGQTVNEAISFAELQLTSDLHQGEVRLKNRDALLEDNTRYWTLATFQRKVLVIADRPSDAVAWKTALEAMSGLLPMSCTIVTPATIPAVLHPDQYQAICLMNLARPTPDLWERLYQYVAAGGGLVIAPGEECEAEFYNAEAALKLLPAQLSKPVHVPSPGTEMISANYDHPIMAQFKQWERHNPPGKVFKFWDLAVDKDSARVIVPYTFENKPALVERTFDPRKVGGRVLLLTTAMYRRAERSWRDDWNQYSDSGNWMAVAWPYLTTRYVLGARETRSNFNLDEEVRFWLPRGPGFTAYDLTGPQNGSGDVAIGQTQLTITQAQRPGNYKVAAPGGSWEAYFSVNLPPAETQFVPRLAPAEVERLFGDSSVFGGQDALNLPELARTKLGQSPKSELLPYLMIGLLLLLAGENLLANRFYRRDPELAP